MLQHFGFPLLDRNISVFCKNQQRLPESLEMTVSAGGGVSALSEMRSVSGRGGLHCDLLTGGFVHTK